MNIGHNLTGNIQILHVRKFVRESEECCILTKANRLKRYNLISWFVLVLVPEYGTPR